MTDYQELAEQAAARRRRYDQLRAQTTQAQAQNIAALAKANPSLAPGALVAAGYGGIQPGSPQFKALSEGDVKVKQEKQNFVQRGLSKTIKGIKIAGGAVLPDFVGDAVDATLGNGPVKGFTRGTIIGLSSIGQTFQGAFRESVADGDISGAEWALGLPHLAKGFRQSDLYQGHREVQDNGGYAGLISGKTDVDYGSGYFAGGDVGRAAGAARQAASTDLSRVNGRAPTMGRYLAREIGLEPGNEAYSIISGFVDMSVLLASDPTTFIALPTKALQNRRLLSGDASRRFDADAAAAPIDARLAQLRVDRGYVEPVPAGASAQRVQGGVKRDEAYLQALRAEREASQRGPVDLSAAGRDKPLITDLEYSPDAFYRVIGPQGFADFQSSGKIRANQSTGRYEQPFFSKGAPLERYQTRGADEDYFVEALTPAKFEKPNGYWRPTDELDASEVNVYRIVDGRAELVHAATPPGPSADDLLEQAGAIRGIRETVDNDRALEWMTTSKEGRRVVEYLSKATKEDFAKVWAATKGKIPPGLLARLTEKEMTTDEVIQILGPELGKATRLGEKFNLTATARAELGTNNLGTIARAKFQTKVRDTRILGTVPERVLPKNDIPEAIKVMDAFMRNALIKDADEFVYEGRTLTRSDVLYRLALADGKPDSLYQIVDDVMAMGTLKAAERGTGSGLGVRQAPVSTARLRELFKIYKNSEEGNRLYWIDQVSNPGALDRFHNIGYNLTDEFIDGNPQLGFRALPHFASEFTANNIPLPDPRAIRAATSRFNTILTNEKLQVPKMALEKVTDNIFKPLVLLRPAYIVRNQIDEQFRPAGVGMASLMSHPVQYMQWLLSDQAGVGKFLATASRNTTGRVSDRMVFKSRGATYGPDGQAFDVLRANIRNAAENLREARRGTDPVAIENAQRALAEARAAIQTTTPYTDGVSQFVMSQTGGLGNWRNRGFVPDGGRQLAYRQDAAYSRGMGEVLHRIYNEPIGKRVALAIGDDAALAQLKQDWWRGPLQKMRTDLAKNGPRMEHLLDEIGAAQYIDETVNIIKAMTKDSPELLAAARTGRINGVALTAGDDLEITADAIKEIDNLKAADDYLGPAAVPASLKGGAVAEDSGRWSQAVDRLFYLVADKPTRFLTKSPVFRQRYYQRAENLIGFMKADEAEKLVESARVANLRPKDIKRLEAKRRPNGSMSLEEADLIAKTDALEFTQNLLYSLHHRSQFFDVTRLLFPFGEAFLDSAKKYSQLTARNPVLPYRLMQMIQGGRDADLNGDGKGFFYTDEQFGEEVFAFPGSQALLQGVSKVPGLEGVEGAGIMRAPLKNLNILGYSVIPGVGPMVQIPASSILPDEPEFNRMREIISPFGDRSLEGGALESFLPAWFSKFRTAELIPFMNGSPQQQRAFAQAHKDTMGFLASKGEYNLQDPADQQRLVADAKRSATAIFFIRGMAQMVAPSPPSPEFVAYDKDGRLQTQFKLAEEYRKIQKEQQRNGTPEAVNRIFMETFGEQAILAIIPNTKAGEDRSPINPNKQAREFYQNNKDAAKRFPRVFGLFTPDPEGAEFDTTTYQKQLNTGERVVVSPDEAIARANQNVARMIMQNAKDFVGEDPTPEQRQALSDLKNKLAEDYPGYSKSFTNDTPGVLEDLKRAANDPQLAKTPVGQGLRVWLQAREMAEQASQQAYGVGWTTAEASRPVRDRMRALAEQIGNDFPGFTEMYERALEREMKRD